MFQRFSCLLSLCFMVLWGASATGASPAGPDTGDQLPSSERDLLLDTFAEHFATVNTQQLAFTQTRFSDVFYDTLSAQGRCWFESPGKLRWEVLSPQRSLLIYNQGSTCSYSAGEGRYIPQPLADGDILGMMMEQITDWMCGDFRSSQQMFSLEVFERDQWLIELSPRDRQIAKYIGEIELFIDTQALLVERVVIHDQRSGRMQIDFSGQIHNQPLHPGTFDIENPVPADTISSARG